MGLISNFERRLAARPRAWIVGLLALLNVAVALSAAAWLDYSRERYHRQAALEAKGMSSAEVIAASLAQDGTLHPLGSTYVPEAEAVFLALPHGAAAGSQSNNRHERHATSRCREDCQPQRRPSVSAHTEPGPTLARPAGRTWASLWSVQFSPVESVAMAAAWPGGNVTACHDGPRGS